MDFTVNVDGATVTLGDDVATVADGSAVFAAVAEGEYDYTVTLDGYNTAKGTVTIDSNDAQNIPVTLTVKSASTSLVGDIRIAVSADGNAHDEDDWAATAATLGIIAAVGGSDCQKRLTPVLTA